MTNESHTFYAPKEYTISHLRAYLNDKFFPGVRSQEKSYFLFAYGSILNNHERLANIFERFKHHIEDKDDGLEIMYAEMASFGAQWLSDMLYYHPNLNIQSFKMF